MHRYFYDLEFEEDGTTIIPIPMYTRDLKAEVVKNKDIPFKPEIEHHALWDAKWNKKVWEVYGEDNVNIS